MTCIRPGDCAVCQESIQDLGSAHVPRAIRRVGVVEGIFVGPFVIGPPGRVAGLENQIGFPIVAHDEDYVAFVTMAAAGKFPDVDAARPIGLDFDLSGAGRRPGWPGARPEMDRSARRAGRLFRRNSRCGKD